MRCAHRLPADDGSDAVRPAGGVGVRPSPHGVCTTSTNCLTKLQDAIDRGHSGLVALVSDPSAVEIAKALDKASRIVPKAVDDAAADDIKAAAKAAEDEVRSN